jgi:hypothetical protein
LCAPSTSFDVGCPAAASYVRTQPQKYGNRYSQLVHTPDVRLFSLQAVTMQSQIRGEPLVQTPQVTGYAE